MHDATIVYLILALTLAAFVWGGLRHDVVALLALCVSVVAGVVPPGGAFAGFGHPAVVTVAAVLVLSRGFQHSGLVDVIASHALKAGGRVTVQVLVLTAAVAVLSAFMNNVGALALLMPVALRLAREHGHPPSLLLMPLAFASLLGGLTTLIGTPPNIIVSSQRAMLAGDPYGMFAFAPVGGGVALAGLGFLVVAGWRLVPRRSGRSSPDEMFETADYLGELEVADTSRAAGWTLRELEAACGEEVPVVAVLRGEKRLPAHAFREVLRPGDVLLLEAEPEELKLVEGAGGLILPGARRFAGKLTETGDLELIEAVVRADSPLVARTVAQLRLADRHGLHLVAVAREGGRLRRRLNRIRIQAGDVLLLQGDESGMRERLADLGCLPLASREITLGKPRRLITSVAIFAAAVAAMVAGWLPAAVALVLAALLFLLTGVLPLRETYRSIDWPIIVLLGAMIPVGEALETSGGAAQVAEAMLALGRSWPPVATLALLVVLTSGLSNVVNNAAAALLMAPIAVKLAVALGVSPDPLLMGVALGASSAFLTPIGHQSNTLVMGPGGYRFGDYWRLGLPLTLIVVLIGVPLILFAWPM